MNKINIAFPDTVTIPSELRRDISNRATLIEKALATATAEETLREKWVEKVAELETELDGLNNKLSSTVNFDAKLKLMTEIGAKQNTLGLARGELAKQAEVAANVLITVKSSLQGIDEIFNAVVQPLIDQHINDICDAISHFFNERSKAFSIAQQFDSYRELIWRKKRWDSVQSSDFSTLEDCKRKTDPVLAEFKAFLCGVNPYEFPRRD